jgi:predicted permease
MFYEMWEQVRRAGRVLLRQRLVCVVVLSTLAIGIAVNATFYAVTRGLLASPFAFDRDHGLIEVCQERKHEGISITNCSNSHKDAEDFRTWNHSFSEITLHNAALGTLRVGDELESVTGSLVDHHFFSVVGVYPRYGRPFLPEDELSGAPRVAILSDALWRNFCGGDPTIIGKNIVMSGDIYTVVGIMPPRFEFPFPPPVLTKGKTEIWFPLRNSEAARSAHTSVTILGRLKPGVTLQQAQAEARQIGTQIGEAYPEEKEYTFVLRYLLEGNFITRAVKPVKIALQSITGIILLLVCVNVAGILLVDAARRRTEIKVRMALGGTRRHIVQPFLLRAVMLTTAGGTAGTLLSLLLTALARKAMPASIPHAQEIVASWPVVVLAIMLSLCVGLLLGIWPPLAVVQGMDKGRIEDSGQSRWTSSSLSLQKIRKWLVVMQLTFAMIFLVFTGLLAASIHRLLHAEPGFRTDHLLISTILRLHGKDAKVSRETDWNTLAEMQRRIAALPEVTSVAQVVTPPFGSGASSKFQLADSSPSNSQEMKANVRYVGQGYFETLGIARRAGRLLGEQDDRPGGAPVAVVNEAFTHQFLQGQNVIGKHVCAVVADNGYCQWAEIVGVVADARENGFSDKPGPVLYFADSQNEVEGARSFCIRTRVEPKAIEKSVRKIIYQTSPKAILMEPISVEDLMAFGPGIVRMITWFVVAAGLLALTLGATGLYGVIASTVEQRRREIGIRMAMGSTPKQVAWLFHRQTLWLLVPGLGLGLLFTLLLEHGLNAVLPGFAPMVVAVYFGAGTLLAAVAFFSTMWPVRCAVNVNPAEVLHNE